MTNNDLEEVILKYTKNCGCKLKYCEHYLELRDTIEDILTQKDQEHKAELESIKGEIENSIAEPTELEDVRIYNIALKDTISILDSHINKLSTESRLQNHERR